MATLKTLQELRKILLSSDFDYQKEQAYMQKGNLVVVDTYFYMGDKALNTLKDYWSTGGEYHEYFLSEYGVNLNIVDSFNESHAMGRHKKLTDNGVVGILLEIKS